MTEDNEWHYVRCSPSDFPEPELKKNPFEERCLNALKRHKEMQEKHEEKQWVNQ